MPNNRLPVYKLVIDEDAEGMDFMGLVDYPAHGKNWIAFNQLPKRVEFKQHFNEEKRIVTGVAIATDLQIYRRDPNGFEYNIVFTKEDVLTMIKMLSKRNYFNNVNLMHDMSRKVKDTFLIELYFIKADKSNIPSEFADQNIQPGSVVMSYWVEGDDTWEFVKKNGAGFSIEGWFKEVEVKFNSMKKTFVTISQVSKWDIQVIEDSITIGTQLHWKPCDPEGTPSKLSSGEYVYDGHKLQVDSDGKVVMIDGKIEAVTLKKKVINTKKIMNKKKSFMELLGFKTAQPEKAKYDKAKKDKYKMAKTVDGVEVTWEGDLAAGTPLFVVPTDGTDPMLASAGEYAIDVDGVIMVATVDEAGLITAVVEGEEMDEDDLDEALQAMKKEYEKKLADQKVELKKEFDDQLKKLALGMDELRESVEQFAEEEGEGGTRKPKKVINNKTPGWRKKK